jgi:hypothetical protein
MIPLRILLMMGFRRSRWPKAPRLYSIAAPIIALLTIQSLLGWSSYDSEQSKAGHHPNRVAVLNERLESGMTHLTYSPGSGYLRSVLDALKLPVESQLMVFSPTSSQRERVNQDNPRAIYFNDDVSVGWVRGSSLIEVAATDQQEGVAFYTLDPASDSKPRFRKNTSCLSCHQSDRTFGVAGLFVLSTRTVQEMAPRDGVFTDQRTPLTERWGGWYVTGLSSRFRHRGNRIGQGWLESLYDQFYTAGYLTEYSDVVALMVLEHQARATNLITKVASEVRAAGKIDGRAQDAISDLTDYLLFTDEAQLPARVIGTSGFAEKFSSMGPRDRTDRSLRQLDLSSRLMRYPCSYMVYSDAFGNLPLMARTAIYTQLWEILSGHSGQERYARLSRADRKAIVEILMDTKSDLPTFFRRDGIS